MGCSKEFILPALRTKNQRMIQVLKCCFQQVFRLIWHPQNHHSTAACTCRCFSLFQKTRCKTTCENTPLLSCWESKSQQDSVLLLAPGDTASDARDILTASVPDHNITTLPAWLTKGFLWGTVPPFIYIHKHIYMRQGSYLGETLPNLTRELNPRFHSWQECPQQYTLEYMGQVHTSSPFLSYLHLNFLCFAVILKY